MLETRFVFLFGIHRSVLDSAKWRDAKILLANVGDATAPDPTAPFVVCTLHWARSPGEPDSAQHLISLPYAD